MADGIEVEQAPQILDVPRPRKVSNSNILAKKQHLKIPLKVTTDGFPYPKPNPHFLPVSGSFVSLSQIVCCPSNVWDDSFNHSHTHTHPTQINRNKIKRILCGRGESHMMVLSLRRNVSANPYFAGYRCISAQRLFVANILSPLSAFRFIRTSRADFANETRIFRECFFFGDATSQGAPYCKFWTRGLMRWPVSEQRGWFHRGPAKNVSHRFIRLGCRRLSCGRFGSRLHQSYTIVLRWFDRRCVNRTIQMRNLQEPMDTKQSSPSVRTCDLHQCLAMWTIISASPKYKIYVTSSAIKCGV